MKDDRFVELASKFVDVVHFMGLNYSTLLFAAKETQTEDLLYCYNENVVKFLECFEDYVTQKALLCSDYTVGKVSQKIESVLWNRALVYSEFKNYRQFIKAKFCFALKPGSSIESLQCSFYLSDSLWHAVGDVATGFSFYSKRATLMALNSLFMVKFADDYSDGFEKSRNFLRRRIKNIVTLAKIKARLIEKMERHG
ncbi:COQ9 family protein [Neorickettsia findlayensis]|uniref:COQ9 family protein n=1 Tax=Neorickettsia findlayensis TaxID=2686014 RepID=A0A6P1GAA0_9RICK|nr:COQ9 family protein [Neorickettsia findlayensis]QHD65407.1 COQ9 family protein [Neorickettsia findlayensis]